MVKKIVALSIAFVLMLGSLLYGTIDFSTETPDDSPILFGKGEGTDTVVQTPAELEKLLNNIPSVNDYLSNASILDVNPDFQTFTMVEDGGSKDVLTSKSYYEGRVVDLETVNDLYHVLEICFATDAVYYHCEGQTTVTNTLNEVDGGAFVKATRTLTSFDIDIYYSKDTIMLKYNDFSVANEEKSSQSGSWQKPQTDANDPTTAMQDIAFEAIEKCFGKWMEVKEPTAEELANVANLPEEQQFVEAMVYEFTSQFSSAWTSNIVASTEGNVAYLVRLSNFINTSINTAFDKMGGDYFLKTGSDVKAAYLTAITGSAPAADKLDDATASANFSIETDEVVIGQNIKLEDVNVGSATRDVTLSAETTFKNINNTVVSLKGETVSTVYQTLGAELRAALTAYVTEMQNAQQGGQE